MEEKMKTKLIFALGILCAVLLAVSVNAYNSSRAREQKWRREMAQRLDAEEKAQRLSQEQAAAAVELARVKESFQKSSAELESVKKALLQEQMVNRNLKAEIDKLSRLKGALEEDLKAALTNGGKPAKQQKR